MRELPAICSNGHDTSVTGGYDPRRRCRACNREASERYVAARKAGVPVDVKRSHARKDVGYSVVMNVRTYGDAS